MQAQAGLWDISAYKQCVPVALRGPLSIVYCTKLL